MGKPFYDIDQETQSIIMELKKKCMELNLANISFNYLGRKAGEDFVEFSLSVYQNQWDLVVKQRWAKTTDLYWITGNDLDYQYSGKGLISYL